ncbi:methyl-accepting chemotaxis protein [Bacteriovorax sp. PP10]|uniref:Methyl-accepting chemotaxis protein n=1 Tax=Bacteriovorax antarcticus TaxID=3088717 RepID=A0ABU5W168_9BACT|nr:methyl-accepting chemotaxis protein [Bacteriovorax sp. PP10]MEA9358373.1 methyl-accepting chemotaxis protein [Bacteriovorax sp. PP10]
MKKSLNFRLLAWAATSIFVVAIFITGYSAYVLKDELFKKATLESKRYAENISASINNKISQTFEVTNSLGKFMAQTKAKSNPMHMTREEVIELMRERFKVTPMMFGLWTGWEPNAFDGRDDLEKDKIPSDKSGRFVPYITRKSDGTFNLEPLLDYDKEGAGDYYLQPKKLLKDTVIPPYAYPVNGQTILMMSLTSPIIVDGIFYGVAGSDIDLSFFQELADTKNLPAGSRILIFDKRGTIVAFSDDKARLLKNIFQETIPAYDAFTIERLQKADEDVLLKDNNLSVLSKIKMLDEEWFVEINIPKAAITGPIYKQIVLQAIIGLVIALFALVIGYILINKITGRIISLADRLKQSAEVTRDGSNTVKDASFQVSSATQEQAAAIQETATTLDEISAMVAKSVDNARTSSELANDSYIIAEEGKNSVLQMRNSMEDIRTNNENVVSQIENSNKEIEGIINVIHNISEKTKVINDIVFQTKLLSFNASVEAARAGENGKGFAVVAEEIGNLAAMSGNSSREINDLLQQSIQSVENTIRLTKEKVEVMISEGQHKVDNGVSVAAKCEQILNQIVKNVSSVKHAMSDVSTAAEEQSKGVSNISDAMNMLDKTTQDNTKTVHQTAEQSEKLFREADNLSEIIFQLEEEVYGKR